MLYTYLQGQEIDLGWEFYLPLAGLVLLIALAVPVWVAIGLGVFAMLLLTGVLPVSMLGEALFNGVDSFALIAVPLFILTGDVLVRTRLSDKLLDIAEATVGGLRSGFGTSTVLACGFLSYISGSDSADAAAITRMTLDRLVAQGYPRPYACALIASGACTGILIPPSIAYIIIGLVLGISASTLFLAAMIPGMMILAAIMLTNIVLNRIYGYENAAGRPSMRRWLRTVYDGRYALIIPVVILGGIYSGVFTPTEAAAVAVVTTMVIGLAQGTLTLADFPKMLESSAKVNGVILPIIALALPLAQVLAALQVPQAVVHGMTSFTSSSTVVILLMIAILMVAGCVMETTPNIVILAPMLLPVAREIGMDDIHFCIVMVTTLGLGFVTPPFGLNLFVVSGLSGEPVMAIARRALPYVAVMLGVVLLLAFIPWLSLVLLRD
jgi:tripartite ATP-independent transporter DctM subunit